MNIFAHSISYSHADIAVREQLSIPETHYAKVLRLLMESAAIAEAFVLSTCNRTVFFTVAHDESVVEDIITRQFPLPDRFEETFVTYTNREAVLHAMRVACGLDSLVVGEAQILGQMKAAYAEACLVGSVGQQLSRLFEIVFQVAKRVRTSTDIGACPVSIASTAVSLLKSVHSDMAKLRVLLIGAGNVNRLVVRQLQSYGVENIIVMSRTQETAESFALKNNIEFTEIEHLTKRLMRADVIFSATTSTVPVVSLPMLQKADEQRDNPSPQIFIDLAVPRDIDSRIGQLPHVLLYTVDDLRHVIDHSHEGKRHAAEKAEAIIHEKAQDFALWLQSLKAVPTLCAYRDSLEKERKEALERSLRLLRRGETPEAALYELSRLLMNKFLHVPTKQIRKAGYEGRTAVIEAAQELFELSDYEKIITD